MSAQIKQIPKILVISQWPKIRNAGFQLISSIKRANSDITVVDYLGFHVESGENLNTADLYKKFDFAIALHFDTPKLLNISTYTWISNPLEYLYLRTDYSKTLLNNFRAYDDFLFNGSELLKSHIRNLLGSEWRDTGHEFYPSAAIADIVAPDANKQIKIDKIFYCGINWEYISDKKSRNQNLLQNLSQFGLIDIYGPRVIGNVKPWGDFKCYKGEIPFDGHSLQNKISKYRAVLAVSSPAHMRSQTSSSRVFEGFAAGIPVISDANHHVQKLFGDLVYYYQGQNHQEVSEDIARIFTHIMNNPDEAKLRVEKAQKLLKEKYAFDVCLDRSLQIHHSNSEVVSAIYSDSGKDKQYKFQIFLFHHHPYAKTDADDLYFDNLEYCLAALENGQAHAANGLITILHSVGQDLSVVKNTLLNSSIDFEFLSYDQLGIVGWDATKLGAKISQMVNHINADFVTFVNSHEYLHYDFFTKKLLELDDTDKIVSIAGRYFSDLSTTAPEDASKILRFNSPNAAYQWSTNSCNENQLGSITFPRGLFTTDFVAKIKFFDLLVPIVFIFLAEQHGYKVHRSRYITLRMTSDIFGLAIENFAKIEKKGFWAQHYTQLSNFNHEINAGYDLFYADVNLRVNWSRLHPPYFLNSGEITYERELILIMRRAKHIIYMILSSRHRTYALLCKLAMVARRLVGKKLQQVKGLFYQEAMQKK